MFADYENVDSSLGRNYFIATCNSFDALQGKMIICCFCHVVYAHFRKHAQGINH